MTADDGKQHAESHDIIALWKQQIRPRHLCAGAVRAGARRRAAGSTTRDGNAYLDCVAGIAVNALGHADPGLVAALTRAGRHAVARLQPLPHGAPSPAGARTMRKQLRRPGLLLQFRRRGQRGRVQVRPQMGSARHYGPTNTSSSPSPARFTGALSALSRPPRARSTRRPSARCCPACASRPSTIWPARRR